ncbi:MAG: lysophospholipid acyltransferase family protein [Alphaproteobacteria bacterium]
MISLRFISYQILFLAWNLGLGLTCFWILLLPRACMLQFVRFYLGGIAILMRVVAGTDFRVMGREHIPSGPCVIAAKHMSPWETMILPLLGRSPAIVLKQELMRIPLWGWYAWKYGNVPVDRSAGSRAMLKMIDAARTVVADKRDILIFPQGTRLNPGEWKPYKVGTAALYRALKVPVVPVALNSGMFWSRTGKLLRTGIITVEFLPPIPPDTPRDAMMQQLQEAIETATNRLVTAEGGPITTISAVPVSEQEPN